MSLFSLQIKAQSLFDHFKKNGNGDINLYNGHVAGSGQIIVKNLMDIDLLKEEMIYEYEVLSPKFQFRVQSPQKNFELLDVSADGESLIWSSKVNDEYEYIISKKNGRSITKLNEIAPAFRFLNVAFNRYNSNEILLLSNNSRSIYSLTVGANNLEVLFEFQPQTQIIYGFDYLSLGTNPILKEGLITDSENKRIYFKSYDLVTGDLYLTSFSRLQKKVLNHFTLFKKNEVGSLNSINSVGTIVDQDLLIITKKDIIIKYSLSLQTQEHIPSQGMSPLSQVFNYGNSQLIVLEAKSNFVKIFHYNKQNNILSERYDYNSHFMKMKISKFVYVLGSPYLIYLDSTQNKFYEFNLYTLKSKPFRPIFGWVKSAFKIQDRIYFNFEDKKSFLVELSEMTAHQAEMKFSQLTPLLYSEEDLQTDSLADFNAKLIHLLKLENTEILKNQLIRFFKLITKLEVENMKSTFRPSSWKLIVSYLKPLHHLLSVSEIEILGEYLATPLTDLITQNPLFTNVYSSKIANVIIASVNSSFGLVNADKSDFTIVSANTESKAYPISFASLPIDNDSNTYYLDGLYFKIFDSIDLNVSQSQHFQFNWKGPVKNKSPLSEIAVRGEIAIQDIQYLINKKPSPNYSQMIIDNNFTGLIAISSNLGAGPVSLVKMYLKYYTEQGFDFGEMTLRFPDSRRGFLEKLMYAFLYPSEVQNIENAKDWISNKISSNELDYFIKEAHGGGDDKVIRLASKNYLIKGEKRRDDGVLEKVYIMYPNFDEENTGDNSSPVELTLSNEEFSHTLKRRLENKGTELIYFNISCWSSKKAMNELIVASNPLLVEIASDASVLSFTNRENAHARVLLHEFRNFHTYEEIRKKLTDVNSANHNVYPFIFPDEAKYDSEIWSQFKAALNYSISGL